jgi:hypothetical protein
MNVTSSPQVDPRTVDARPGPGDEPSSRAWPRCEPASTHFELGSSSDYQPTAVMAKRYTPKFGARRE